MSTSGELSHLAGPVMQIGPRLRQRCLWCGATIIDEDLSRVAIALPDGKTEDQARADGDLNYPTWEIGAWVVVDGPVRAIERTRADHELADATPENSCARLDPAVTA